jgi:hypothetical protein
MVKKQNQQAMGHKCYRKETCSSTLPHPHGLSAYARSGKGEAQGTSDLHLDPCPIFSYPACLSSFLLKVLSC